jgi:hypothetical protein
MSTPSPLGADPTDQAIAALEELNRVRFERVEGVDQLRPLDELLLCPPPSARPGVPRAATYLGERDGRAWLFARDRPAIEALEREQLAWALAEGMVFAARPRRRAAGAHAEALAAYARRHALDPAGAGAHLAGRVLALRAVARELSALSRAQQSEPAGQAIEWAGRRVERLLNEAHAAASAIARADG